MYGAWWWPAYQPVAWAPWPGYGRRYSRGFWWGRPVGVSRNFFFGSFNWRDRHVRFSDRYQRWQAERDRRRATGASPTAPRQGFDGRRDGWQRGERRIERQSQQLQQPATRFQAQPAVAAPAITAPAQPRFQQPAQPGAERDRARFERREARQAAPAQPRVERQERREARQERREERARAGTGRS